MANTQQLERKTFNATIRSLRAHGAITANRCVAVDTAQDAFGETIRPVSALADKISGVVDQSCNDGQLCPVLTKNAIVPLTCVDSSIVTDVLVYNDATGKVSATQGSGASLIGRTRGRTTAANQLVPVELA